jgi:hypothetical protein
MLKTIASAAVVSATALTLGLTAPANADLYGIDDPQDTFHGSDLLAVQLKNGDRNVVVTTYHTNLRRDPATGSAGSVYLDTDRNDRGPEFVFVGGYFRGTDYQLLHTEGFGRNKWGAPADGSHEMTVDYAKETVRMRMSRRALDRPGKVRVAVRMSAPAPMAPAPVWSTGSVSAPASLRGSPRADRKAVGSGSGLGIRSAH